MKGLTTFNLRLRIVPVRSLQLHEEDDPQRVSKLVAGLECDGKLKNPIIVAEQEGNPDAYVVLDGATRTSALLELGYPYAIVQIVDYFSPTIALSVWYHAITGFPAGRLLAGLEEHPVLSVSRLDDAHPKTVLNQRKVLACITLRDGHSFALAQVSDLYDAADRLCELVSIYRGIAQVHRTAECDLALNVREYPDLTAVVSFPVFRPAEILRIAANGNKVPMGITRHMISGRALGLGLPLEYLRDNESLEARNEWLEQQIRERLYANKIRLYQEPVLIFDD